MVIFLKNNIIHLDMDAFYASVEESFNPELKNKPMVVSGLSNRSIVTTANYKARKYGIHSAMPLFIAKTLCPNLIVSKMHRNLYIKTSNEIFEIMKTYSPIVEKVSIDEGYMDISSLQENGVDIIQKMKKEIYDKTSITVSCGLSYNKFLAKLASDWNKPNGLMIISKSEVPDILLNLDVSKIHGIGKASIKKLEKLGINKVSDLYLLSEEFLSDNFGKMGSEIYKRIRGIDNRKVTPFRKRKSIGVEKTFPETNDEKVLKDYIQEFSLELEENLLKNNSSFRTMTLKFKDNKFVTTTHSKTFIKPIYTYEDISSKAIEFFSKEYNKKKLRLLGITASNLEDISLEQLSFL